MVCVCVCLRPCVCVCVCTYVYVCIYVRMYVHEIGQRCPARHSTGAVTLIAATIYLQLIQNRYMFRSFTVLQCSHQHCVQPVASDVEVVGYL